MVHGGGEWRGTWWMEWVCSTLQTSSKHGVSSITTADAHNSAASSPLNWRPRRFKWTPPFRRKTNSGFCACAITFQTQSNSVSLLLKRIKDNKMWKQVLRIKRIHHENDKTYLYFRFRPFKGAKLCTTCPQKSANCYQNTLHPIQETVLFWRDSTF